VGSPEPVSRRVHARCGWRRVTAWRAPAGDRTLDVGVWQVDVGWRLARGGGQVGASWPLAIVERHAGPERWQLVPTSLAGLGLASLGFGAIAVWIFGTAWRRLAARHPSEA
jgi:hypothetical protein